MPRSANHERIRERLQQKVRDREAALFPRVLEQKDDRDEDEPLAIEIVHPEEFGTRLLSDQSNPFSAPYVRKLDRMLERMCYAKLRTSSLPFGSQLDGMKGSALAKTRASCEKAYAKILKRIWHTGATLWDAYCVIFLLEMTEPDLFRKEITFKIKHSKYGWITSIVFQLRDGTHSFGLIALGSVLKNHFNSFLVSAYKTQSQVTPITNCVYYLESWVRANSIFDYSDYAMARMSERIGFPITSADLQTMHERAAARVEIIRSEKEQSRQKVDKLVHFAQQACARFDETRLSRADQIKRSTNALAMLYPTICASLCYNIFTIVNPIRYYYYPEGGHRTLMVGQYHSPAIEISPRYTTNYSHYIINSDDCQLYYIAYGYTNERPVVQEYHSTLFNQQTVININDILEDANDIFNRLRLILNRYP